MPADMILVTHQHKDHNQIKRCTQKPDCRIITNEDALEGGKPLVQPLWETIIPGWFGLAFCAVALIGFTLTLHSFGDSFRVGIDKEHPNKLVTSGMQSIGRCCGRKGF
jgi:L-ascorbate metabolism protein UlaG (beta-lactamase superfamily)